LATILEQGRSRQALSGEACRAARALLRWSVLELAHQAHVSPNTIVKLENGRPVRDRSAMRIRARFAREQVELLDEPAPGARLLRGAGLPARHG
jgi:transcriptional regulator with XRE-family HTH domain